MPLLHSRKTQTMTEMPSPPRLEPGEDARFPSLPGPSTAVVAGEQGGVNEGADKKVAQLTAERREHEEAAAGAALHNDSPEHRSLSSHSADEGAHALAGDHGEQRGLKRERNDSRPPAEVPARKVAAVAYQPSLVREDNPGRAATFGEAQLVVLSRSELEAAAARPGEDVHSLARGALVRVRSKDACYTLREVYRARLAPPSRPDRPPQLQLQTYQDYETSISAEQVSNSPPSHSEWASFVAELAESGRRLTLAHVRAVAHNLGRALPPPDIAHTPEAGREARPASPSSADAERARRRAERFSEAPPLAAPRTGSRLIAAAAAAAAEAAAVPLSPPSASQQAAGVSVTRMIDARGKLGAIIGSQGATVKAIQSCTGAAVEKVQERGEVRVEGLPHQVAAAVAFIQHIISASQA